MQLIFEQLEKKKCWKSFLKTQCRRNKIDSSLANTFTIIKIRSFFKKLQNTEIPNKSRLKSSVWLQNELKAYQWMLVAYSSFCGVLIQSFGGREWSDLSDIFHKDECILQYQAKKLISERQNTKRKWQDQEINLLQKIVKQDPDNNRWNEIARTLFELSHKLYFRSGKQCRERWFNHLDPYKKHGAWESAEDRFIAEQIIKNGKKWSQIAKKLQNQRTQHMIKNRYKSILIKIKKKYPTLKPEKDLLEKFIQEEPNGNQSQDQSSNIDQPIQQQKQVRERLDLRDLPVMESGNELEQGSMIMQQNAHIEGLGMDKYPSSFRECQFQQVVTPCPIIYQTFTPNFLNTPNSITFIMNYSFDHFEKNQNLFLKNN